MESIIINYLNEYKKINPKLTDDELDFLKSKITTSTLKKGEYFLKSGKIQKEMGFVHQGLLRSFYLNENGEEITIGFIFENTYASDYSAFISQKPSKFYIQCLEDTTFINLSYVNMQKCYSKYKNFEKYGRLIAEQILVMRQNRIESFLFDDAEKRYLDFIKDYPQISNRISLTHLSSFLGIKRQSLSRIRKKLTK